MLFKTFKKIKAKKQRRTRKYAQKAGTTKLGRCYIEELPNNNLKLILGRRKYITKHFDVNPVARNYVYKIANDPLRRHKCIVVARLLDAHIKSSKRSYKK